MIKLTLKYNFIFGRHIKLIICNPTLIQKRKCNEIISENSNENQKEKVTEYPTEPTTCCMSGCPNCVWLEYAEKLSIYFQDGGKTAIKEINEKVQDSNVRAFLLHELRMKNKT